MRHGSAYKTFVYFLCTSFLFVVIGVPTAVAKKKEKNLPIGEMISRGEVKFEARENVWEKVASAHFPIFEGLKIKIEQGLALIALDNQSQLEAGENSLFSFQNGDEFHLFQGQVSFRLPPGAKLSLRVGELSIGKPQLIQASNSLLPRSSDGDETVGSITLNSDGSVSVDSIRGPLSVYTQDRVVLTTISPQKSVTILSKMALGEERIILAQGGEPIEEGGMEPPFGLESWTWFWIPVGLAAIAIPVVVIAAEDDDDDIPIVPVSP